MAARLRSREIPYQDFSRIKSSVNFRRDDKGQLDKDDLFTDPSFPPDWSSLTYVYSGDDKYERTVFKRPTEDCEQPTFIGVGGVIEEPFPWKHWKQRGWFQAAVVIMSLNVRFIDRLIPGYKILEQNFNFDYIGAFRFNMWRFTDWVEIVVDDHLPMLDDTYLFCKAIGTPPEYWGALAEKAYAKCKKTFQAIEYGNLLDALTDLTGCICEYYNPDVNPAENLFHIMYKSNLNRSMMVCWRNDKRLTTAAFDFEDSNKKEDEEMLKSEETHYLHLVTATTKFPCTDGRIVEMIRLKCPYNKEPKWRGKYSDGDTNSWNTVSAAFKERFRPLSRKEEDEYWVTMDDFRCNFGGLVIISSMEPFSYEGLTVDRRYTMDGDIPFSKSLIDRNKLTLSGKRVMPDQKVFSTVGEFRSGVNNATLPDQKRVLPPHQCQRSNPICSFSELLRNESSSSAVNGSSVKDNDSAGAARTVIIDCRKERVKSDDKRTVTENHSNSLPTSEVNEKKPSLPPETRSNSAHRRHSNTGSLRSVSSPLEGDRRRKKRVGSLVFGDLYSSSEISLHICNSQTLDDQGRPRSAPSIPRNHSTGSLSSLTQINFLATKADFFRAHGKWKTLLEHRDRWTKNRKSAPRINIEAHAKGPRVLFHVSRAVVSDTIISPSMQGKRHVLISLLQDYRHGPSTANSLLVPIGFCIYKSKNPDRDERRHITKLHFVGEREGKPEQREINARFDLEPGSYFLIPYFAAQTHEGEFLIRILTEGDPPEGKGACTIS